MTYPSVVLGGTFDRLHKGHHALFHKAFSVGNFVTIGLTTDRYVHIMKDTTGEKGIASYQVRKSYIEQLLNKEGWNGRYMIIPLEDTYGPTMNPNADYEAIIVSTETRSSAEQINTIRKEQGIKELDIVEIPMVPAQDLQTVSSTRVRSGQIDTTGRLVLPDALRPELRKSIGVSVAEKDIVRVLKQDRGRIVITVGDMTTKKVIEFGYRPYLAIIDFQMKRKPFLWNTELFNTLLENALRKNIQSGPGYISCNAMQAIHDTFKSQTLRSNQLHTVLIIDGEEDLLVLPVLIEAPIGSVVYYGQPPTPMDLIDHEPLAKQYKGGIIRILITEKKKKQGFTLINKFIPKYEI